MKFCFNSENAAAYAPNSRRRWFRNEGLKGGVTKRARYGAPTRAPTFPPSGGRKGGSLSVGGRDDEPPARPDRAAFNAAAERGKGTRRREEAKAAKRLQATSRSVDEGILTGIYLSTNYIWGEAAVPRET